MHKKILYYATIISVFLIISCTNNKTPYHTDLDNLFALKKDSITKDSIAKAIEGKVKIALQLENTIDHSSLIDSVLNELRWTNEKQAFFELTQIAIKDAKDQKDYVRLANTYQNIAVYYQDINQLDSVYYYYTKAENIYENNSDSLAMAENRYYQSRLLYELGLFMESEIKLTTSMRYLLDHNPKNPILVEAIQLRAFHDMDRGDYDKALISMKQILDTLIKDEGRFEILPKQKYYLAITNLCSNIANLNNEIENYTQSEYYSNLALKYLSKNYNDLIYAFANIPHQFSKYNQDKNHDIIEGLLISYNIYEKLNHTYYKIEFAMLVASIYENENNNEQALSWAKLAYRQAKAENFFRFQKQAIEFILAQSNYNDPKLVQELIELNYHIEEEQSRVHQLFTKTEHDSVLLSNENHILKQRIFTIVVVSIIITLILLFIVFYLRLRSKNKELYNFFIQNSKNQEILDLLHTNSVIEYQSIAKERNRIAKDLHDGVVNSIFVLRFSLQQLKTSDSKIQESLVEELIGLEKTVRTISHSLAESSFFNDKSFESLIRALVTKQTNGFSTEFALELQDNLQFHYLSTLQKMNIYLILQEALQNINKHSYASQCMVKVTVDNIAITFSIIDNGVGFRSEATKGLGLSSMKERANDIHANLEIESYKNKGTVVSLFIPLL
ncbi:histidine kinase [Myroides sp. M-43]|uniref:ATP-binding protein n=1 Tax=Myroides oncorhynchi TaxID=2893756 RepID=UPI001E53F35E|nr:ATP-binding protein [Myroides oncorhynchi]MCC9043660.1 histidine kinase [Myroides oncorhynchi]